MSTTEEDVLRDLMARRWTRLGKAPRGKRERAAIVAWDESKVIITGGYENSAERGSAFIYNIETSETEALPSMLQARASHAAVIVGGNLFVIGGYGPGEITNSVQNSIEVLDLNDPREWKQFPVRLREARYSCSAVAIDEHEIYIIGGSNGGQILDSVEILNTSTQTISQGPPMLESRMGFSAALIGDSIVVAGGWHGQSYTSTCEQLSIRVGSDEEASRWQPLHSMTTERGYHHGLSFGNCMVVVGGFNPAARDSRMIEVWNGTTDTWTQLPAELPIRGFIYGSVKLGDDLVCFVGGRDPSVHCHFSSKGLLEHQRRQIRFNELIADERVEIVVPLLLEGLGQRGWTSLFYECIRETNGRLIPQRRRSALGKRQRTGRKK